ncbi:glutathione S-transferase T3-like [Humulus lupulus]|uniref:glutathione S-transferase T3-like n=1 Tax=Humulus lupulus TaxID=3486 RepID=UPI002B402FFD|nr:glutathione S-transferase T3-like [Humulus lupulus]
MVSRNYRPSMEKSSIDLNRETSSASISETQLEHGVEGLENVVLHNEDESRHKEYYNTNQKGEQARTGRQCKDHWNKMNEKVVCFKGCYKRVQQAHHSGWCDEKILENAYQLYKFENSNSNFLLVDCWRLLKDESKWKTMYQPKGGKRTKVHESGAFTSSSNVDINDDEVREVHPTGQKVAKRKGKEKKKTHTLDL